MKIATIAVVLLAALCVNGQSVSAENRRIGDLICSLGDRVKGQDEAPVREPPMSSVKQNMLCIFRNTHTGVEETYHGSFQSAAGGITTPRSRTLLWGVDISLDTPLSAGVLDQRYEAADTSEINKAPTSVEGQSKHGVSLYLITERKEDAAFLLVVRLQLQLVNSSA
jgi:hypothetical protein